MKQPARRRPSTSLDRLDQALANLTDTSHLGPWAKALAKRKAADLASEIRLRAKAEHEPFSH